MPIDRVGQPSSTSQAEDRSASIGRPSVVNSTLAGRDVGVDHPDAVQVGQGRGQRRESGDHLAHRQRAADGDHVTQAAAVGQAHLEGESTVTERDPAADA